MSWFNLAIKYNKLLKEHVTLQKDNLKLYEKYGKLQDEHISLLEEFIEFEKRYNKLIELSSKLMNLEEK